jgi:intracellular septation protein
MKLLLDFLPIVLFFGAYKMYGVYVATGVLMAATALQMAYIYFKEGSHTWRTIGGWFAKEALF